MKNCMQNGSGQTGQFILQPFKYLFIGILAL